MAQVAQDKADILQEQKEKLELCEEKLELMQQNMKLQDMYDQQVAENSELFRKNNELRFPGAYGKLRDVGTQAGAPQVKDTKVRTRGQEFTKKLNNGRGETRGIQHGERRNRFQGK